MRWISAAVLLWISGYCSGETLHMVYNGNYAPFSFRGEGRLVGIEVDLMSEVAKRVGLAVKHEGYPWERAQSMVRSGAADGFVTIATPERREYVYTSSAPLLTVPFVGLTARDNPRLAALRKIGSLQDSLSFRHVNYLGSGWAKQNLAGANVHYLTRMETILQFLALKRADLFIENAYLLQYGVRNEDMLGQLVFLPTVFGSAEYRLGISKKSPFASRMAEFDRAIGKMVSDGTVGRIVQRYSVGMPH